MERFDDVRVVSLGGEHDVSTAGSVRALVADAGAAGGLVLVDLTAATFIDTTIAGVLLEAFHAETPPRLRFVVPAQSFPRRAFQRMGFATGLPIYEQLEDALQEGR
jgi:anti-sigma B factor antagonist